MLINPFGKAFPIRQSARFLLRQIQASDRPQIFAGLSNPRVIAHYGISYPTELATQEQIDWYAYLEKTQSGYWWAICDARTPDRLLGTCGIYEIDSFNNNAEIGYWLLPEYWGLGVMHECLLSILHFAFDDLLLHRVHAEVEPANIASAKLLQKLGFVHEGRRRQAARRDHTYLDLDLYARLASHEH